eukprot:TRINITY_DN19436_c0_g1_i1.p1 TRINITY_DN19436_c0_g1~~TRINITY_DN19436_c0_g1_i1.p1  ORF type:complete len:302 (-),score=44.69 TRINITY_DN19436_c0_g1_i1:270-1142(-)
MARAIYFVVFAALAALARASGLGNPGACVVRHCAGSLASCFADGVCRGWQLCIMGCKEGDLACQIRCADLYKPTDDSAAKINTFSKCVISDNHCVPQQQLTCKKPAAYIREFDMKMMKGQWYITKGWNPLFDCFDCQVHHFSIKPDDKKPLHGDLKYSVKKDLNCTLGQCEYLSREVFQSFSQDPASPGHLINHNNTVEELHYSDDWYVLAAKQDTYVLIYYCGCNDATCGYAGAVLYTRSPQLSLSDEDVADVQKAIETAGVADFTYRAMCTPDGAAKGCASSPTSILI